MAYCVLSALVCVPAHAQKIFEEGTDHWAREVEQSYLRGIGYLTRSQNEQGYWVNDSYGSETGVVGLVVVAILAHGDDPNFGPYKTAIRKGINYILGKTNKETGYIGTSMYNHGFATLALAEAYGAVADPRIGPALRRAVDLIVNAQKKNPMGAWRYSPESKDADVTVSGAQMVALMAARNAGLLVPDAAIEKGKAFMIKCQAANGGFGYTSKSGPNAPRSAIGCLTLALTKSKDTEAFAKASKYVLTQADSGQSHYRYYNLYYTSQAIFHASPEAWRTWNAKNVKRLKSAQNENGSWSGNYGTTFSTSAALLSLALNYRFLPIYER
ncbi:MAG: prenyltransferase/squalene oxidase repeat-containing protein [Opitutales bacterium]